MFPGMVVSYLSLPWIISSPPAVICYCQPINPRFLPLFSLSSLIVSSPACVRISRLVKLYFFIGMHELSILISLKIQDVDKWEYKYGCMFPQWASRRRQQQTAADFCLEQRIWKQVKIDIFHLMKIYIFLKSVW